MSESVYGKSRKCHEGEGDWLTARHPPGPRRESVIRAVCLYPAFRNSARRSQPDNAFRTRSEVNSGKIKSMDSDKAQLEMWWNFRHNMAMTGNIVICGVPL